MYDAIVVGARCAGSPTAMLLAQRGYSRACAGLTTTRRSTTSEGFGSRHVTELRWLAARSPCSTAYSRAL